MKVGNKLRCDNCQKLLANLSKEEMREKNCFYALCLECGWKQYEDKEILDLSKKIHDKQLKAEITSVLMHGEKSPASYSDKKEETEK